MDKALNVFLYAAIGLGVGFVAGFAWGQGTRSAAPGNVKTEWGGGVLTIKVDAHQAAKEGIVNAWEKLKGN